MKNSQKGFAIPLIIAIIAVLAIGGGTYIYLNKEKNVPLTSVSHSDWKTYTNDKAGYSIQYPSGTDLREGAYLSNQGITSVEFYNVGLSIYVLAKDVNWAEQTETCSDKKPVVIIDNVQWQKITCTRGYFDSSGTEPIEYYVLDKGDFIYKIELKFGRGSSTKPREPMEAILKTFKFIPMKSADSSAMVNSMKGYTNDRMKISLQYPSDWTINEGENVVIKTATPNGEMRFDMYQFKITEVATRSDLKETSGCKISESTNGAQLICTDNHLSRYVVKYRDSIYLLNFTKNSYQETDPERLKYNQLTTEMFEKNAKSFEKILASIRFIK